MPAQPVPRSSRSLRRPRKRNGRSSAQAASEEGRSRAVSRQPSSRRRRATLCTVLLELKNARSLMRVFEDLQRRHSALAGKRAELRPAAGPNNETWFALLAVLPAVSKAEAEAVCRAMGAEGATLRCRTTSTLRRQAGPGAIAGGRVRADGAHRPFMYGISNLKDQEPRMATLTPAQPSGFAAPAFCKRHAHGGRTGAQRRTRARPFARPAASGAGSKRFRGRSCSSTMARPTERWRAFAISTAAMRASPRCLSAATSARRSPWPQACAIPMPTRRSSWTATCSIRLKSSRVHRAMAQGIRGGVRSAHRQTRR